MLWGIKNLPDVMTSSCNDAMISPCNDAMNGLSVMTPFLTYLIISGESAQLANDFNTLCEKFFPCRELAKAAVINDSHRYHIPQEQHLQRVMNTK